MYIFVYGTLKRGDPNHQRLKGSEYVCTTRTKESYAMLDLGPFPGVLKAECSPQLQASPIHGEVYHINSQTLEALDSYEGEWYFREEVQLEGRFTALMYFLRQLPVGNYTVIPDGNWTKQEQ